MITGEDDKAVPHEGGEGDEVVVLVDVVHDLRLEEHLMPDNYERYVSNYMGASFLGFHDHDLSCIIHDLIRELRLCDVFPQLLDPSAARLWGAVLVNHLQDIES